MQYDAEYLATLKLAPKDGNTHLGRLPFIRNDGNNLRYFDDLLQAMQRHGYEIITVSLVYPIAAINAETGLWVLYR